jgi:hypothetical protein
VWFLFQELPTSRVRRQPDALVGAPTQADVNDPYIQEIASAALAEVDRRSNAIYRQKVVRIVNAQKQVCLVMFLIILVMCSITYS